MWSYKVKRDLWSYILVNLQQNFTLFGTGLSNAVRSYWLTCRYKFLVDLNQNVKFNESKNTVHNNDVIFLSDSAYIFWALWQRVYGNPLCAGLRVQNPQPDRCQDQPDCPRRPSDIFASQTTIGANWQIFFVTFRFVFVIPGKVQSDVLEIIFKNRPELRRRPDNFH